CGACGNNRTNRGGFQFAAARLPWFAVMTGLGVARMAFSSPLRVERREIPLQRFPVLAKTDPLAEFRPPADGGGPKADDDFAGIY
ncbi:hypothetical protein AAGO97_27135, partial [Klebsiella pneumoniae]